MQLSRAPLSESLPCTTVVTVHIMGAVLLCPGCRTSQAVKITANTRAESVPRWRGLCLECAHSWDFDDE